ncbi:hypothetical protein CP972_12620 [Streptomyces prasinus]|uniref:SH3 domain-containing protein n=1 Tax=Streptomyces prasinus TaxID=67345 RepID=A0ABX6AV32_9ACTN|nr:hypothetical protein CP972_12620 [Streptomyces prasinus]
MAQTERHFSRPGPEPPRLFAPALDREDGRGLALVRVRAGVRAGAWDRQPLSREGGRGEYVWCEPDGVRAGHPGWVHRTAPHRRRCSRPPFLGGPETAERVCRPRRRCGRGELRSGSGRRRRTGSNR